MVFDLKYSRYNSYSILVEWPAVIDSEILNSILFFKKAIENNNDKQSVEVISAYNSLLIIYSKAIDNVYDMILELKSIYLNINEEPNIKTKLWKIPVCYDDAFAQDIENISTEKNITKQQIIELHSQPVYTVYFIGFLPGFLYLGGLDSRLFLERKATPNLLVKKGAVAIGGEQTGIYPNESPGGWHIIGNSPIELFNPQQSPPCQITAGDQVQFYSIDKTMYADIKDRIEKSEFNFMPSN